jgi:uncharacterized phiE125 gp8 family phage protein
VSLGEVEHALGLPPLSPVDPDRDALLNGLISAARAHAEMLLNRDLVRKQWDLYLDAWPQDTEITLRAPLVSVDLVRYTKEDGTSTTLTPGTDFEVFPELVPPVIRPAFGKTWPGDPLRSKAGILVRFTSGYASDAPFWGEAGNVKIAIKMLVAWMYYSRAKDEASIPEAIQALLGYGAVWR